MNVRHVHALLQTLVYEEPEQEVACTRVHLLMHFITDVKRVWPGPGRQGMALLQVGVSVPINTVTTPLNSCANSNIRITLNAHFRKND